mmetsp:Transcript_42054/g.63514  ORF Transcript_42054/g.63514 Transcript_42054/m.63514 type:complete len:82 (-) Transcript_42054:580-825(-)
MSTCSALLLRLPAHTSGQQKFRTVHIAQPSSWALQEALDARYVQQASNTHPKKTEKSMKKHQDDGEVGDNASTKFEDNEAR